MKFEVIGLILNWDQTFYSLLQNVFDTVPRTFGSPVDQIVHHTDDIQGGFEDQKKQACVWLA